MALGRDITSANSILTLSIENLYTTPQQIQGFSAEDVFDAEPVDNGETQMGVDGKLSAGFIYAPIDWSITLMADSDSNDIFDNWYQAEVAAVSKYFSQATVLLPAIGKKWAMSNGVMVKFPPMPNAKKVLQPRKFTIRWERISAAAA
jgi:hypothetical protein